MFSSNQKLQSLTRRDGVNGGTRKQPLFFLLSFPQDCFRGPPWTPSLRVGFSRFSLELQLHRANIDRLPERRQRIAFRHELVRKEPGEARIRYRLRNCPPVQLLSVIELVSPRNSARVKVRDVLDVVADGSDYIAFHYLHVIDVVQQLHAR